MNTFFGEFKKFIMRGNVIDLAVGVVIGTAFNSVVNALVNDIITPPLGLLLGRIDFQDWALNLGGDVNVRYGLFLQAVLSFVITAFALFLLVRFVNRLERVTRKKRPAEVPPEAKSPELAVLEQIRDSLKARP
jgi:large conductance mechanosensitive channel